MSVTSRRLRSFAAVALATGLALGAAACSKDDGDNDGGSGTDGEVTITLQTFGSPGYDQAVKDFTAKNPNIKVDHQKMGELRDYNPKLVQWLAAGEGAGDVVMLEEGNLQQFLVDNKNFADLKSLGSESLKDTFLPYKWEGGFTADKKKHLALGTDVGGLAMCYRTDLFAKAGFPTDREQVGAMWSSWQDYAAKGAEFKAKNTGATWLDSSTSIMQPYIMQKSDTWFYSRDNKFIADTNPVVKEAWDFGLKMAADGLTGKLPRWQPDWDAAFANSKFATVPCPAWYTGIIKQRAGEANAKKWDIAKIPGNGGNWGGSYLAIPEQSTKKKQAFELIKYLTGKEGALAAYKEVNAMPSVVPALDDPAFKDSKDPYFNDAPTGQIFGASAKSLKPIHLGPKHQTLWEQVLEPQMQAVERGQATAADAWKRAMEEGKKQA